jgi:hypothetical protein
MLHAATFETANGLVPSAVHVAAVLGLYAASAAATAWMVRAFGRPLPRRVVAAWAILPVLFLGWPLLAGKTVFPVDQVLTLPPWSARPHSSAHNANLNDVATQMAPWNDAARKAYAHGELPWLDRWNGCGTPLAANGQSAAFSPFTLASLALPLAFAFDWLVLVKLYLSLVGMWLWLRELRLSSMAAALGASVFSLSLGMTAWLLFPLSAVLCTWPWALFFFECAGDPLLRRRARAGLVSMIALWPTLGHMESVVLGGGFLIVWTALRGRTSGSDSAARRFGDLGFATAGGVGLSAVLLAPQLLAILRSNRAALAARPLYSSGLSPLPHWPVWSPGLLTPLFPRVLGDGIGSPMLSRALTSFPEMGTAYVGVAAWSLAFLVLRPGRRRREAVVLAGIAAGAILTAAGCWPLADLQAALPVLRMMLPLRFYAWSALAVSALAAFELDRLRRDLAEGRTRALPLALSAAAISIASIAAFLHYRPFHAATGGLPSQERALAAALLVCAGGASATLWARRRPNLVGPFLLLLALVELGYQGRRLYRLGDPAEAYPETPLVRFLRDRPGPFRIVGDGPALFPNTNVLAGVEGIRTHDAVESQEYVRFLDATAGYDPRPYFKFVRDLGAPVLDLLNVRYIVGAPGAPSPDPALRAVYSGADGVVWDRPSSLPRVFVPWSIAVVRAAPVTREGLAAFGSALARMKSERDWGERGYLLIPGASFPVQRSGANGAAAIGRISETTNSIRFDVRARDSSVAVVSVVQDGGWRAFDERGRVLPTTRADGPLLAVALPEGASSVCLRYTPPGLRSGGFVTLVAAALLTAGALRGRAGRTVRRGEAGPPG